MIMDKFIEFADARFRVSEGVNNLFLSTYENGPDSNKILDSKTNFLIILREGTTMQEAEALKDQLNRHISKISIQRHA